ncbi:hypothetical protein HPB48_013482 [Haemaphysalis longicornis]|uniref:Uncharacterized protein n=1 Tax=Haemaphysalis longicornis TaxID=44386 RepID=A0A9J6FMF5_HAELO|nr:hypothetical protein HPB48_013482 [Haemaphysalis longicornis]
MNRVLVRHQLRVRLHKVAFSVTSDTIRKAFSQYGDVNELASDRWCVQYFESFESTTRIVPRVLHEGVSPDRLPHQLQLGPGTALVAVHGRAPMCLRCHRIRRECRVPRCTECHVFGHEQADCTRSLKGDNSELVMDEGETEGAAPEPTPSNAEAAAGVATTDKFESNRGGGRHRSENGDSTATASNKDGSENMDPQVQLNKRRHEEYPEAVDEKN